MQNGLTSEWTAAYRATRIILQKFGRSDVAIAHSSKCNKSISGDSTYGKQGWKEALHILSLGFVSPTANIDRNSLFANKLSEKYAEHRNGSEAFYGNQHTTKVFSRTAKLLRVYFNKTHTNLCEPNGCQNFSLIFPAQPSSLAAIAIHLCTIVFGNRVIFLRFICVCCDAKQRERHVNHNVRIGSAPRCESFGVTWTARTHRRRPMLKSLIYTRIIAIIFDIEYVWSLTFRQRSQMPTD